jgi:excisionase family DNA binding protein
MRNFVNGGALLAPSSASQKLETSLNVDERLFTAQEVAARLGVSERWVRDHATRRKPRLRAIKLGPLLRFRWSDVQALVAQQATEKPLNCR